MEDDGDGDDLRAGSGPGPGPAAHGGDPQLRREGKHHLIVPPSAPEAPVVQSTHFDPEHLEREGRITGRSEGRRTAWFLEVEGVEMVLRHYWRGGLVANVSDDLHLFAGVRRSRPWREVALLSRLHAKGLPVPEPMAARLTPHGLFYRADLLTRRIPHARTFARWIREEGGADEGIWKAVGRTIRRFHDVGAHHADLNVRNILLDRTDGVWLIDWDKGRMGRRDPARQERILRRLRRSLAREPELERRAFSRWQLLARAHEAG